MSLAKLFLSGLLIAGGLILGLFTLHGYFDPQWAQKQAHASVVRDGSKASKTSRAIDVLHGRNRFVARSEPAPASARPAPTQAAVAAPAVVRAAEHKPASRPAAKKKVVEKPKPAPQQQAFVWPWNLFGN